MIQGEIIITLSGDYVNNKYQTLDEVLLSYRKLDFVIFIILLFMCIYIYITS